MYIYISDPINLKDARPRVVGRQVPMETSVPPVFGKEKIQGGKVCPKLNHNC